MIDDIQKKLAKRELRFIKDLLIYSIDFLDPNITEINSTCLLIISDGRYIVFMIMSEKCFE